MRRILERKAKKAFYIGSQYHKKLTDVYSSCIIFNDVSIVLCDNTVNIYYKNKVVKSIKLNVDTNKFTIVGLSRNKYIPNTVNYHVTIKDPSDDTNYGFTNYNATITISKFYNTLLNIWYFITNLFNISLNNPLKTWWKARKYFVRPKAEIHFFKNINYNCPFASYNYVANILHITSRDVMWKWKWESVRHERDPFIWICLFKHFGFSINFKVRYEGKDMGMYYWEYLLDYLYNRKDINTVDKWTNVDGTTVPTKKFSLKDGL